ncbi:porin family protein [Mariniflexile sp.]|uniref:porin family protein n=1 Tax=Mariniflexile sp. TaxID=1979402 RepID=UPI00356A69F2
MKSLYFRLLILLCGYLGFPQQDSLSSIYTSYKEDQFYIGTTYNLLGNKPEDLSQKGFSSGIHFGIIKDIPLNKEGNIALGIGLGYSLNSFNQNLFISVDDNDVVSYEILESSYTKNKFSTQLIELPFEFRWRTSTATEYKFWRIYTGFRIGYMVNSIAKHNGDLGVFKFKTIEDFNKFQYGLTLSAGYNTWNLHLYYGLNPIFSSNATLEGEPIDSNVLKVGLMFYIL